jgi:hypothetical protein
LIDIQDNLPPASPELYSDDEETRY